MQSPSMSSPMRSLVAAASLSSASPMASWRSDMGAPHEGQSWTDSGVPLVVGWMVVAIVLESSLAAVLEHRDAALEIVDAGARAGDLHLAGDVDHAPVDRLRLEEHVGDGRVARDGDQVLGHVQDGGGAEAGVPEGLTYDHAEYRLAGHRGRFPEMEVDTRHGPARI